jgi:hypothetical protein
VADRTPGPTQTGQNKLPGNAIRHGAMITNGNAPVRTMQAADRCVTGAFASDWSVLPVGLTRRLPTPDRAPHEEDHGRLLSMPKQNAVYLDRKAVRSRRIEISFNAYHSSRRPISTRIDGLVVVRGRSAHELENDNA